MLATTPPAPSVPPLAGQGRLARGPTLCGDGGHAGGTAASCDPRTHAALPTAWYKPGVRQKLALLVAGVTGLVLLAAAALLALARSLQP